MSSAPSGFNTPKTNWASVDVVTPTDMNRIEGNIQAIEEGSRTIDPAQAPASNVGTLRQLLDWFANRIKAITGGTNWYDAPVATLANLLSLVNGHIGRTDNPHSVTAAQAGAAAAVHTHDDVWHSGNDGAGSGLDADTVDGKHASDFVLSSAYPFDAKGYQEFAIPYTGTDVYSIDCIIDTGKSRKSVNVYVEYNNYDVRGYATNIETESGGLIFGPSEPSYQEPSNHKYQGDIVIVSRADKNQAVYAQLLPNGKIRLYMRAKYGSLQGTLKVRWWAW